MHASAVCPLCRLLLKLLTQCYLKALPEMVMKRFNLRCQAGLHQVASKSGCCWGVSTSQARSCMCRLAHRPSNLLHCRKRLCQIVDHTNEMITMASMQPWLGLVVALMHFVVHHSQAADLLTTAAMGGTHPHLCQEAVFHTAAFDWCGALQCGRSGKHTVACCV